MAKERSNLDIERTSTMNYNLNGKVCYYISACEKKSPYDREFENVFKIEYMNKDGATNQYFNNFHSLLRFMLTDIRTQRVKYENVLVVPNCHKGKEYTEDIGKEPFRFVCKHHPLEDKEILKINNVLTTLQKTKGKSIEDLV